MEIPAEAASIQKIIGIVVFVIVVLISTITSIKIVEGETLIKKIWGIPTTLLGTIFVCYIVLGIVGGVLWAFMWIGILIRHIFQWLLVAILYPWQWLL